MVGELVSHVAVVRGVCAVGRGPARDGWCPLEGVVVAVPAWFLLAFRPELRQGYPLNLSISISGGKETNQDSPSNGERTGKSPV